MATGTVLVTGASTGIGEATVLHLKTLGFDAIGAVRKDEDAERLEGRGVRTVRIDVSDADQIAAARDELGDAPLAGLVNNAGIAVAAPLEFLPIDQLRHQLEINLIGQVAVTQAFLPALRRARGRIVNVSSIGGRVALPLVGAYNASKFALEGMSDALRRELRPFGVDVILVEPGGVKTPIWTKSTKTAEDMLENGPPDVRQLYGKLDRGGSRAHAEDRPRDRERAERRRRGDRDGADSRPAADALPRRPRCEAPGPYGEGAPGPRHGSHDPARARGLTRGRYSSRFASASRSRAWTCSSVSSGSRW